MADKRMFSRKLISSDVFLDMPLTAQGLFFHLCMRADDDGFVDSTKKIMREVQAKQKDLRTSIFLKQTSQIPDEKALLPMKKEKSLPSLKKKKFLLQDLKIS